jgi:hypothetical protein
VECLLSPVHTAKTKLAYDSYELAYDSYELACDSYELAEYTCKATWKKSQSWETCWTETYVK